jgi:hypothetical protein
MKALINLFFQVKTLTFLGVVLTFNSLFSLAQTQVPKVPTPVEFMAGNNRLFFQIVVKKKFSPESRFGFLTVSTFSTNYDNESKDLDLVMPVLINFNIYKGFGLVGGTTINNRVGFSPLVGGQHSFANKDWVSVTIASFFLNASRNVELFGIYEYKPKISPAINLYTRLQLMYIHNTAQNHHARSFLQLRAGLKRDALNFGLGANLDQYGPEKDFKPNYGVFVGWAFQ